MITKILKTTIAIIAIIAGLNLSSCKKDDTPQNGGDKPNKPVSGTTSISNKTNLPALTVNFNGSISEKPAATESQTFTFNRFPDTIDEFKTVREKIGPTPGGAVVLEIMAMEMYSHNKAIGQECIKLCVTTTYQNMVPESFQRVFYEYKQPYAAASLLKGATPANGYNPTEPYTIEVEVDPAIETEVSSVFQASLLNLKVKNFRRQKTDGTMAKEYSQFAVVKTAKPDEPSNDKYYLVQSSGDILVAPEPVSFKNPYKGLEPFK